MKDEEQVLQIDFKQGKSIDTKITIGNIELKYNILYKISFLNDISIKGRFEKERSFFDDRDELIWNGSNITDTGYNTVFVIPCKVVPTIKGGAYAVGGETISQEELCLYAVKKVEERQEDGWKLIISNESQKITEFSNDEHILTGEDLSGAKPNAKDLEVANRTGKDVDAVDIPGDTPHERHKEYILHRKQKTTDKEKRNAKKTKHIDIIR